jgi:hypothetical protein
MPVNIMENEKKMYRREKADLATMEICFVHKIVYYSCKFLECVKYSSVLNIGIKEEQVNIF